MTFPPWRHVLWRNRPGHLGRIEHECCQRQGYEKLGINNLLLPENVMVPFAQRADIARTNGTYADLSQAGRVGLGWHIDDAAIARVNEHLSSIEKRAEDDKRRKLLIIDELGRLELDHESGLVEAMRLLRNGPYASMKDALVVVRETFAGAPNPFLPKLGTASCALRPPGKTRGWSNVT